MVRTIFKFEKKGKKSFIPRYPFGEEKKSFEIEWEKKREKEKKGTRLTDFQSRIFTSTLFFPI